MHMPDNDKAKKNHEEHPSNRTGEDIDMLHEKDTDPQSDDNRGSYSYKDDYDAA
jgi:hypothetical protein